MPTFLVNLGIVEFFLDIVVIENLAKYIVNYAVQNGNHSSTLTSDEGKSFVRIMFVSSYSCVPRRQLYWQKQPDVYNELIAESMRRDHFGEIVKYLHAANNTKLSANDKFGKVSPLLKILNGNFVKYGEVVRPGNVSLYEWIIPYFGRHITKQFIRVTPVRWRYKAWMVANPRGYA